MDFLNKLGLSKRHIATLLCVLAIALNKKLGLGLETEDIQWMVFGVVGYVVGDTAGKFAGTDLSTLTKAFLKMVLGEKDPAKTEPEKSPSKDTEKVEA